MIDKEVLQFFMEAIISIISRCDLTIVEHHRNQCNKTMLVLCKQLIYFNSNLHTTNLTSRQWLIFTSFLRVLWHSLILGQCILGGGWEGHRGGVDGGKNLIKEERRHKQ